MQSRGCEHRRFHHEAVPERSSKGNGCSNEKENESRFQMVETKSFREFKSNEEYLLAMKEDLAEWLNNSYHLDIDATNFMEKLETGVVLCRHANIVLKKGREWSLANKSIPPATFGRRSSINSPNLSLPKYDVIYRSRVRKGTFQARDNISNFISWCRSLQIPDCILFETDDLVMRKNEKNVILCLLEVARKGSKFGMTSPLLVQMEQEIDREIEAETKNGSKESESHQKPKNDKPGTGMEQSLHERVLDAVSSRCSCRTQFSLEKISDGKYRIGDTKLIIFVRILRRHVMVRVGGGWDTLENFLDKHDPCRCRSGHRFSTSAKLTLTPGKEANDVKMSVTYSRPEEALSPMMRRKYPLKSGIPKLTWTNLVSELGVTGS